MKDGLAQGAVNPRGKLVGGCGPDPQPPTSLPRGLAGPVRYPGSFIRQERQEDSTGRWELADRLRTSGQQTVADVFQQDHECKCSLLQL